MSRILEKMIRRREFIKQIPRDIAMIGTNIGKLTGQKKSLGADKRAINKEVKHWKQYREELYVVLERMTVQVYPSRFKAHVIKVDGTSEYLPIYPDLGGASLRRGHAVKRLINSGELIKGSGQTTRVVTQRMQTTSDNVLGK